MKRLRKKYPGQKIKFFHAGEYGEKYGRPHHHACLFNYDFPDKRWYRTDPITCSRLYTSAILEDLWPFGNSQIGEVTFESAAYVARYVCKKILGDTQEANELAASIYRGRIPEYGTCSRGGRNGFGLSHEWLEKYKNDVYPKDFIVIRGKKSKVPKYYDKKYELTNPVEYAEIADMRKTNAILNPDNCTARLLAGEQIKTQQVQTLKRKLQ